MTCALSREGSGGVSPGEEAIKDYACLQLVKRGDVCTFGFLYSDGPVARPGDGPGRV